MHSNVKLEMTSSDTAKLLAAATGPVSPAGAYTCRAGFTDGSVLLKRVWILNNSTSKYIVIIISSSNCSSVMLYTNAFEDSACPHKDIDYTINDSN